MILAILPIVKFSIIIAIYTLGLFVANMITQVMYSFRRPSMAQIACIVLWPVPFVIILVYIAYIWLCKLCTGKDPHNFRW